MKTPPKTVKFSTSTSMRQSLRHRGDQPSMESRTKASINWFLTYINSRLLDAPEVQMPKNAKYPTPLPPMFEDVVEEGDLLANIP